MDVLMPQLGETVAEGKITKWFKAAGDAVKPGDNLFEIETDKTSMEVPSTTSGTLTEIRLGVGEVAKVGAVVAVIGGAGEAARPKASAAPSAPQTRIVGTPAPTVSPPMHSSPMPRPAPPMDPFHAVRTPERNYGPATLASGTVVTPLARRL
ncbi:MAG TPA: biotin/lipoyl-containing protein, partial [Xanthobacteraceae bacterium]|nr:biotin/lipoyl-containing protein [Xanthobacteraceae bacterium]